MRPCENAVYLGDSVYAHFVAKNNLVLTTGNHDPFLASNKIILEPQVFENLKIFIKTYEED